MQIFFKVIFEYFIVNWLKVIKSNTKIIIKKISIYILEHYDNITKIITNINNELQILQNCSKKYFFFYMNIEVLKSQSVY